MSRYLKKDLKSLSGLKIKLSNEVWDKDKKGKYTLKKDLKLFGRVESKTPNMILRQNKNKLNPQTNLITWHNLIIKQIIAINLFIK